MGHETAVVFISSGLAKGPGAGGAALVRELPREWHDRRCAEGQVPEIVRCVAGWKQALRDFMQRDERLNDVAGIFSQKFVQMGVNKNFTLSTLMDLAWKVLVLTWEAILEERLPLGDELDKGFKDKYRKLQDQLHESRTTYLKELSRHRDEKRKATYGEDMCKAIMEIDDEVYCFVPEDALDDANREYFNETLKENLKLALTRGASAAGEQLQLLTQQLRERDEELAVMSEARESMERQLEQLRKELADRDKAANRHVNTNDGSLAELERVRAELAETAEEKQQLEKQVARLRAILQALGYDPDNLSEEDLEGPRVSSQATKEMESTKQLLASAKELNRELRKQMEDFERRLSLADMQLERQEQSAARAAAELQAQVQKLTRQLAEAQAENEALRKAAAESAAEVADLKASLADLRKTSRAQIAELAENRGSGAAAEKQLREQVESLEAVVAELREEVIRQRDDAARAEAELQQERDGAAKARAEVERLRKQLDELRSAAAPADASEELESELKRALARIADLEKLNTEQEEEIRRLKERIKVLSAKVTETKAMKDAMEASFQELTQKFALMKEKLAEYGVDTVQFDKIVEELGIHITPINKPGSVFQRLYYDAMKRKTGAELGKVLAEKDRNRNVRGVMSAAVAAMSMGNKLNKLGSFDEGAEGVDVLQASSEEADSPASRHALAARGSVSPLAAPAGALQAGALQVCPHCGMHFGARPSSARISFGMPALSGTDSPRRALSGPSLSSRARRASNVSLMAEMASKPSRQSEMGPPLGITGFKAGAVHPPSDNMVHAGVAPPVPAAQRSLGNVQRPSSAAPPSSEADDAAASTWPPPAAGLMRSRLARMKVAGVLLGKLKTPPTSPTGGGLSMGSESPQRDHSPDSPLPGSPARGSASSSELVRVPLLRKLSSASLRGDTALRGDEGAQQQGGDLPAAAPASSAPGPQPVAHRSRTAGLSGSDALALRRPSAITGHAAAAVGATGSAQPRAPATAPALLAASSGSGRGRDASLLGVHGRGGGAGTSTGVSASAAAAGATSAPLQRSARLLAGVGPRPATNPSDLGALTRALSYGSVGGQRQQAKATTAASGPAGPARPAERSPPPVGPEGALQPPTIGLSQAQVARSSTSAFECLDSSQGPHQVFHRQLVEVTTSLQAEPTGVWIQAKRGDPAECMADAITSAPIAGARRAQGSLARTAVEGAGHEEQDPLRAQVDGVQKLAVKRSSVKRSHTTPTPRGPTASAGTLPVRAHQQPLHGRALPRWGVAVGGADLSIGGGAVGTASRAAPAGR